jgi:pantoate--beta-alanine ligase
VDVVFAPPVEEMYPHPISTFIEVEGVSEGLCGEFRPGHFRGVAIVVAKLFHITQPDRAYFGEKDAQQLAVIQRMVADLNMPVEIVPVATVREPDGLALSSRNQRLNHEQRALAPVLYAALRAGALLIELGEDRPGEIRAAALAVLARSAAIRTEYLEVVDPASMKPVETVRGRVRIAAAAWLGNVRLIDNTAAERIRS